MYKTCVKGLFYHALLDRHFTSHWLPSSPRLSSLFVSWRALKQMFPAILLCFPCHTCTDASAAVCLAFQTAHITVHNKPLMWFCFWVGQSSMRIPLCSKGNYFKKCQTKPICTGGSEKVMFLERISAVSWCCWMVSWGLFPSAVIKKKPLLCYSTYQVSLH